MVPSKDKSFQFEGELDTTDAQRLLPRLEEEKVRFELAVDSSGSDRDYVHESRVKLFVHVEDLARWRKVRELLFPV